MLSHEFASVRIRNVGEHLGNFVRDITASSRNRELINQINLIARIFLFDYEAVCS